MNLATVLLATAGSEPDRVALLAPDAVTYGQLAGRAAVRLWGAGVLVRPHGLMLHDGVFEADLAVTAERSFHGLAWRIADESN